MPVFVKYLVDMKSILVVNNFQINRTVAAVSQSQPIYYMSHKADAAQAPRCAGAIPLVKVHKPCARYQCGVERPQLGVPLVLAMATWEAYQ